MIDLFTFKLFYPMLFITIGIVAIILICSAKSVLINFKDKDSQNFQFKTHVEEHQDTTTKMKDMHNEVVKVEFTPQHEKEIHHLEVMVKEIRDDVNLLFERIALIEQKKE